jgi:polyhydroxyalkanoate synthesis regulator phasin
VGAEERIAELMRRYKDVSGDVVRLEGLVDEQRGELDVINSSRIGGGFHDEGLVSGEIITEEEEDVRRLEERVKEMQEQVLILGRS